MNRVKHYLWNINEVCSRKIDKQIAEKLYAGLSNYIMSARRLPRVKSLSHNIYSCIVKVLGLLVILRLKVLGLKQRGNSHILDVIVHFIFTFTICVWRIRNTAVIDHHIKLGARFRKIWIVN